MASPKMHDSWSLPMPPEQSLRLKLQWARMYQRDAADAFRYHAHTRGYYLSAWPEPMYLETDHYVAGVAKRTYEMAREALWEACGWKDDEWKCPVVGLGKQ
jgi:hypothetical protein